MKRVKIVTKFSHVSRTTQDKLLKRAVQTRLRREYGIIEARAWNSLFPYVSNYKDRKLYKDALVSLTVIR